MLGTWLQAMHIIIQNAVSVVGGKLDFSNASNSSLLAVISF